MTSLPSEKPEKRLGLVIDLDICIGCHACVVSCKEWNSGGDAASLLGQDSQEASSHGAWLNRMHTFEVDDGEAGRTVHFPKSCMHCEDAHCVTVCPTGASYKRQDDGIVLVDADRCIGCGLCAWACPYGARELDEVDGVMKKCTLCIDRLYNETLPPDEREPVCVTTCPARARHFGDFADETSNVSRLTAERTGYDLMPEMGYHPTSKYLPPRSSETVDQRIGAPEALAPRAEGGFLGWLDRALSDLP